MESSKIATALESLFSIGQPVFLWGPPGVGKSQVVKQTAGALGLDLIDIRALLLDPVDLRGLPRISAEGLSEWCAPSFLPKQGEGVLFLDELNAAPPLVQASCYQLVLDRRLGEYELPPGWSIVAAGNREQDRAVSHRMPSALANRFVHLEFTVDPDQWLDWAVENRLAPEVIAFIRFRPGILHQFDPERDTRAFPSPRSWEFVSRLVSSGPAKDLLNPLVAGAVGAAASAEFCGFMALWEALPRVADILEDPMGMPIPDNPAVLFALCEMMGRALDNDNAETVLAWASRLPAEFSVLLMREAVRRDTGVVNSRAFAQWASDHSDVLV